MGGAQAMVRFRNQEDAGDGYDLVLGPHGKARGSENCANRHVPPDFRGGRAF